jgi:3,4-dihydroxy 2-butanone 4-phosphate synthase
MSGPGCSEAVTPLVASITQVDANIQAALEALQNGEFVLVFDAEGREEETDLVVASEFSSPARIREMRTQAGGLICTTVPAEFHERVGLPYLSDILSAGAPNNPLLGRLTNATVPYENGPSKPSFGLTINHRDTFTGVTDNDRALTITRLSALIRARSQRSTRQLQDEFAKEFKAPGHVNLLNVHPQLLAKRRGHTELSTALCDLAGLSGSATICEMMNGPSGRALPKAQAIKYAAQNGLVFLEGKEVVAAWEQKNRGQRPASSPPASST